MSHVLLSKKKKLLLVDLDGVLITSCRPEARTDQMLYPLHGDQTGHHLANSGEAIAVLTHRHKAEAEQILKLLGIDLTHIVRCYVAQDLWYCARKYKHISQTFLKGLRKSLILPLIRDELGYHPRDIAVIDDRLEILSEMSSKGVGLTLLAPFQFNNSYDNDHTTTFDLSEALRVFEEWSNEKSPESRQHISLIERVVQNHTLLQNSCVIVHNRLDPFSLARNIVRAFRRLT